MPDWSYQPLFKPLLFKLPFKRAREITLKTFGSLAKIPFGLNLIEFLGNTNRSEINSKVGLGGGLVFDSDTLLAFSKLGFSFMEVGPVTISSISIQEDKISREKESIYYPFVPENSGINELSQQLKHYYASKSDRAVKILVRLSNLPGSSLEASLIEYKQLMEILSTFPIDSFVIDTRWWGAEWSEGDRFNLLETLLGQWNSQKTIYILVSPGGTLPTDEAVKLCHSLDLAGIIVGGGSISDQTNERLLCGQPTKTKSLERVRAIRKLDEQLNIIGSGGIIEPQDALDFLDAGANQVQLHSGLIFSGPSLPKRIHANINRVSLIQSDPVVFSIPSYLQGWVGFLIASTGLMIASLLAMYVGLTTVLLPYDEAFLGLSRGEIPEINNHLLHFMQHDRVTLAGTSMSAAILFISTAVFGVKVGYRWAYRAEVTGLTAGFLSFFLYAGFNYFDPLHALVCLLIAPFFLWGLIVKPQFVPEATQDRFNSKLWHRSLIGQFMFIAIGFGLLVAGFTIALVGCTTIFVNEDLHFMGTTREALAQVNVNLLPLIAHDRASFGGFLWPVGIMVLLLSLHGFQPGRKWIWWTLCLGGLPGFLSVMLIHFSIGYTHFIHLFPAYIAFLMYITGLYLSYGYLCKEPD